MIDGQIRLKNLAYRLGKVQEVVSVWLSVRKIKSFTDDELIRFAKDVMFGFEPDAQLLVVDLRFHHADRRLTESEMKDLAKEISNGDAVVEELLLWSMFYNGGRAPDAPSERDGAWFWQVGRNASHEFYAGTDGNGKRYRYSAGESCELDEHDVPGIEISEVRETPDWSGYYGHF